METEARAQACFCLPAVLTHTNQLERLAGMHSAKTASPKSQDSGITMRDSFAAVLLQFAVGAKREGEGNVGQPA